MAGRLDERGVAYAGSQLQMQIYVNRRSPELSRSVLDALPSLASLDVRLTGHHLSLRKNVLSTRTVPS